jgi:hypothetical protein
VKEKYIDRILSIVHAYILNVDTIFGGYSDVLLKVFVFWEKS